MNIFEIINMIDYESKLLIIGTCIGIFIGWYFTGLYYENNYKPKEAKE